MRGGRAARTASGSGATASMTSREHGRAFGIVGDADGLGPASTRWRHAPRAGSTRAKPRSTPIGSLSRSQRDTCTTSGVSRAAGAPSRTTSAARSTRPGVPSSRTNVATRAAPVRRDEAGVRRGSRAPRSSSSGWFFAENGSMLGGMIDRALRHRAGRRHVARRARTRRRARRWRYGARKSPARGRPRSLTSSWPM